MTGIGDLSPSSPSGPERPDRSGAMPVGSGTARADVAFRGWMSRGACLGADPELFFPAADRGPALHQISAAKRVCQLCTVRALCLTYAVATRQSGIWGGTTLEERFAMQGPARWRDEQASRPAWASVAAEEPRAGSTRHRN